MKRKGPTIWLAAAVAVTVVALVGWRVSVAGKTRPKIGRTVEVRRGDITVAVAETGALEPVVKVDVKSRVAGRVKRIFVREGERVNKGAAIALVDASEVARQVEGIRAQLAAAKASLRQAQETYDLGRRQTQLGIRGAEAALATARARERQTAAGARPQEIREAEQAVARARAEETDARRNLDRRKSLLAKGFIAQSEVDAARTRLEVAVAQTATAREALSLVRAGARREEIETARMAVREAQIRLDTERANAAQDRVRLRDVERARAQVRQIENQLAQENVQLRETRIVAPISGEVARKYLEEGELIASATAGFAQGAAVVTIADLSRMQVRVNINEVDVTKVRVGQLVEITVDGIENTRFAGRVASIAPSSTTALSPAAAGGGQSGGSGQNAVVKFEVKVAVTGRDTRLRPGMTAAVDIILNRRRNVLLLPFGSVRDGKVILVTGRGDSAVKTERAVVTGVRSDASVEVVSGLRAGEKIEVPELKAADRRKFEMDGP